MSAHHIYTDHDADTVNRAMGRLEDRARDEIETCALRFDEWLLNVRDTSDLAQLVAQGIRTASLGLNHDVVFLLRDRLRQIADDYTQYRVEAAQAGRGDEWFDLLREETDEHAEEM